MGLRKQSCFFKFFISEERLGEDCVSLRVPFKLVRLHLEDKVIYCTESFGSGEEEKESVEVSESWSESTLQESGERWERTAFREFESGVELRSDHRIYRFV